MDLKSYLAILRANIWVILTTLIIAVAVTAFITFTMTPVYTATTTLRIATSSTGTVSYQDYMYADRLINTYTKLAVSRPVMEQLRSQLSLSVIPKVTVAPVSNTELLMVTVENSDPIVAQNSANTLAEILIDQGKELYTGGAQSAQDILAEQLQLAGDELDKARQEYDSYVSTRPADTDHIAALNEAIQLKENTYANLLKLYEDARLKDILRENLISIVEPAVTPTSPSKPNIIMNLALGFIAGLAGGVGLAFLFENLGTGLYTTKQIEAAADLNVIGKIPTMQRKRLFRLMNRDDDNSSTSFKDSFRRLQIQMLTQSLNKNGGNGQKIFLITSSEPGEGKSTIVANLGKAMAQSGKKVVIVDCDLHIPKQHILNNLPNNVGLSSVLNQETTLEKGVKNTRYPGLQVITSGPTSSDPAKLLGSPQMKSLLKVLSQHYDVILLDTPALLAISDTTLLISLADGVIFVARRNYIREDAVREATRQLADINANIVGLVVNEAELHTSTYYDKR